MRRLAAAGMRAARRWIPAVLAAVTALAWSVGPSAASETAAGPRFAQAEDAGDHRESKDHAPRHAPGRHFRAQHIDEPGAHGHQHAVVTVDGLALLLIRDEGPYKTPQDRAEAVARVLEESVHQGDRIFVFDTGAERPGVYVVSHHGAYPRLVLRVTSADAAAYSSRSGRPVSQELLGEWWTALLEDFVAVLFLDQAPGTVTSTHAGKALLELRAGLTRDDGNPAAARVQRATAALPFEARERLRSLAFSVPKEFVASPNEAPPHDEAPAMEPL